MDSTPEVDESGRSEGGPMDTVLADESVVETSEAGKDDCAEEDAEETTCTDHIHCEVLPHHADTEEPPDNVQGEHVTGTIEVAPGADGNSDDDDETEHGDMIQNGYTPPGGSVVESEDDTERTPEGTSGASPEAANDVAAIPAVRDETMTESEMTESEPPDREEEEEEEAEDGVPEEEDVLGETNARESMDGVDAADAASEADVQGEADAQGKAATDCGADAQGKAATDCAADAQGKAATDCAADAQGKAATDCAADAQGKAATDCAADAQGKAATDCAADAQGKAVPVLAADAQGRVDVQDIAVSECGAGAQSRVNESGKAVTELCAAAAGATDAEREAETAPGSDMGDEEALVDDTDLSHEANDPSDKPEGGDGGETVESDMPEGGDGGENVESDMPEGGDGGETVESDKPEGGDGGETVESDMPEGGDGGETVESDMPEGGDGGETVESDMPEGGDGGETVESDMPEGGDGGETVESDMPEGGDGGETVESDGGGGGVRPATAHANDEVLVVSLDDDDDDDAQASTRDDVAAGNAASASETANLEAPSEDAAAADAAAESSERDAAAVATSSEEEAAGGQPSEDATETVAGGDYTLHLLQAPVEDVALMVAPPCEDVALMVAPPCEEVTLSDDETTVSGEESAEAMLGNLVAPPGSGTAANAVAEGSEGAADDSMEVDEEVPLPKLVELIDIDADSPMEVDEAELEQVAPPGEQTVGHEVAGSAEGAGEVGESQQRGGDSESAAGGQQTGSADNAAGRSNDGAGSRGSGAPSEGTQDGLQSHGSELGMEIPTEITPTSKVDAVADQVISRVKSEPIDEEYKDEPEVLILFEKLVNVKTEPVSDQVVGVLSDSEPKSSQDSASKLGISRHICIVCKQMRKCKYNIVRNGDVRHLCTDECFKKFRSNAQVYLSSPTTPPGQVNCTVCDKSVTVTSSTLQLPGDPPKYACSQPCLLTASRVQVPEKSCSQCQKLIKEESGRKQLLSWESMDFCSENCLGRFQSNLTASCAACAAEIVPRNQAKIVFKVEGEMKQFCSPACLKTYRNRLKMCSFCDKNITSCAETFSLPVAEEKGGGVKDFCSRKCTTHYETKLRIQRGDSSVVGAHCSVCSAGGRAKHEVLYEGGRHRLCSDACFAAFRYANKLAVNTCDNCGVFCFNEDSTPHYIQFEGATKRFCSFMCMSAFKVLKQKVAACTWCQSKKLNFDMIERTDSQSKYQLFCSLNCLSLYRVNLSATSSKQVKCDQCCALQPAQYHLTMSDASVRNFCSYGCVMTFQNQFTKSGKVPPATPARQQTTTTTTTAQETAQEARRQSQVHADRALQDKRKQNQQQRQQQQRQRGVAGLPQTPTPLLPQTQTRVYITTSASLASMTPVISQVMSLAPAQKSTQVSTMPVRSATLGAGIRQPPPLSLPQTMVAATQMSTTASNQQLPVIGFGQKQVIIQHPPPKQVKNKSLLCKPVTQTKATSCRPHTQSRETQTDESIKPVLVPIPVPVFVPVPVCMYTQPAPIPFAFPVPVPIPCFIPTTKNSAAAIFEHIKEIQEKIPSDPFEADLIMMAAMIAEENTEEQKPPTPTCISPAAEDEDEDVASPLCDPPSEAQSNEDTAPVEAEPAPPVREPSPVTTPLGEISQDNDVENHIPTMTMSLRRPEPVTASPSRGTKRSRRGGNTRSRKKKQEPAAQPPPLQSLSASTAEPGPDASCSLKYTYGVNAWKNWVQMKNASLEAASTHSSRFQLFKTELLQMTAEELSYSLCLFVKEVRKPNGECYASDSVYYLCLGIQSFLYENGRVDNIFTDLYYMKFADCLHELISSYEPIISGEGYVLGRIEEEILWESRQLGAHSPNVLLNTLMYFNSKYFHLKDVAEHMQLSFSQILKHWRRKPDPDSGKKPPRTIFLRYFPLTLEKQRGPKRKSQDDSMWLEQAEKLDNPLRCPVKLYEFYLSKCPESMKNKSDVYYLIPERSCVPDSPVWYSTLPLTSDQVGKMLTRIKMTREINEALYNSAMLPT